MSNTDRFNAARRVAAAAQAMKLGDATPYVTSSMGPLTIFTMGPKAADYYAVNCHEGTCEAYLLLHYSPSRTAGLWSAPAPWGCIAKPPETIEICKLPDPTLPPEAENMTTYVAKDSPHRLMAPTQVLPEAAQGFLKMMPGEFDAISKSLGIYLNPFASLTIILMTLDEVKKQCGNNGESGACFNNYNQQLLFPYDHNFYSFKEDPNYFNKSILNHWMPNHEIVMHELTHVMTSHATPRVLIEGIAEYMRHLTNQVSGFEVGAKQVWHGTFFNNGSYQETGLTGCGKPSSIKVATVGSGASAEAKVTYIVNLCSKGGITSEKYQVSLPALAFLKNSEQYVLRLLMNDNKIDATLYERDERALSSDDDQRVHFDCGDDSVAQQRLLLTKAGGELMLSEIRTPYATYEEDQFLNRYVGGYCLLKGLGHEAVRELMQRWFAAVPNDACAPKVAFPMVNALKEIKGWSQEEAESYLHRYRYPIEDEVYKIGGFQSLSQTVPSN
ncbi:MAG: hypothetical protein COV45_00905 [Deltaproteobacteria bacterium CG11_big_fil_rev_8_21_14_0_20_47_16]|nr:MAG: hypothetical protein COV45_00905 [Deltaproteobacteria bacterium CG11_big_fil_rev_8_21_14_0_20_47_16]